MEGDRRRVDISVLDKKAQNGVTLYFYPGWGWATEERLAQPDIEKVGEIRAFDSDPENIRNCKACPRNEEFSSWEGKLPCGQQHCWVEVTVNS